MIGGRTRDAGEDLPVAEPAIGTGVMLAEQAPEVSAHGHAPFRRVHQRRRPFDGVDLGNEGGVHQPRLLEQPFAIGRGVVDAQPVHDRIVLAREQRVQDRQPDPPIAVHAGELEIREVARRIDRQVALRIEVDLSIRTQLTARRIGAHQALPREVGSVDLRAVPPMGLGVAIGCGLALVRRAAPVVRQRAQDRHVGPRPVVARRQRQLVRRVRGVAAAMAQPVVHHELQPGGDEHVEMRHRHEVAAREQIAAHLPWIGLV